MKPDDGNKRMSLSEARSWCRAFAYSHYENFSIASKFLPQAKRDEYFALYAFARGLDDVADDENVLAARRLESLNEWEVMLRRTFDGNPPSSPVFIALQPLIIRYEMSIDLFLPMIDAFRMDQTTSRYKNWNEVLGYTKGSANPVGKWVLRIHGYNDPELDQLSDSVCTGLQLVNFIQDIFSDYMERDRIYLPQDEMLKYEVSEKVLGEVPTRSQLRNLLAFQANRAESLLHAGYELIQRVKPPLKKQLILFHGGGRVALEQLIKKEFDVNSQHIKVTKIQKLALIMRSLRGIPV